MVLVIVLLALNEYYVRVVLYNSQWNIINRGKKSGPYDAVAFGSSYCRYGIDFGDYNGYNFGYSSQFFYYTEKMLKEYTKDCLKPGGVVFLIIADLVFAETGKGMPGSNNYISILSTKSLGDEFSFFKYIRIARFPLLFNPKLIKSCLFCVLKGNQDKYYALTHNELSEEKVDAAAKKRCDDWCNQFGLKNTFSSSIPTRLEDNFIRSRALLTSMIQFCLDSGFRPILVVTPVSNKMNANMSDEFINKVLFENIQKANIQNVPFLNYLKDSRFQDPVYYGNNADFLNSTGRKFFTRILLNDTYDL